MNKSFRLFTPAILVLMALCTALAFLMLVVEPVYFVLASVMCVLAFFIVIIMLRRASRSTASVLSEIEDGITRTRDNAFIDSPIPVITIYEGGEVIWCSQLCRDEVFDGDDVRGLHVSEVLPQLDISQPSPQEGINITCRNRDYTAFVSCGIRAGDNIAIVYLVDDTELKFYTNEYYQTQPSVAMIVVDNFEELLQDYKDTERAQLMSEVERAVEQYVESHFGFYTRMERDKYMAIIQERGVKKIIENKFELLDRVRKMKIGTRMSVTVSIGIGREAEGLYESESMARQALDMCLGRGGDQATVKTQNGYEFYGGLSKGIEKRTKVKTRIIANALSELIEAAGNVIIMGHRFADLDSLGSCVGMLKTARAMNKSSVICIDKKKNLVGSLLQRLLDNDYSDDDFVNPDEAMPLVNSNTLLIIMDAHVPHVVESEPIYRACNNVVVIDHHRKLVSYIDNAVIFYHEPYASSASEMVSELMQYFPVRPQLNKVEAEALLSGIMLDTKNFVLRTGVRTFEAAAYLRRRGADTSEVRSLFTNSMENYQQKTSLVANAEIYHGCAIAASDYQFEGVKIVAPQAADELMSISGVDASFVIFMYDNVVNVSARSMGAVNVQLVMERLGGGGHHTMAAAQFPNENPENIRERVMLAIDEYMNDIKPKDVQPEPPVQPETSKPAVAGE